MNTNRANPTVTLPLSHVIAARNRLAGVVTITDCPASLALSEATGCQVYCKREYLQRTGSFKERGARNALAQLTPEERNGVIAASAGNHALGLAWHGKELGIPITVVIPKTAPLAKVATCRRLGATVVLHGDTFDQAREYAGELAQERSLTYIHPFDDPRVIAGQGTLGLEILDQVPDLEAIIVPIGGGGLLAGVATVLRALKPEVLIVGAEPEAAACFSAALQHGRPVQSPTRNTLADGLAVAQVGSKTLQLAQPLVDKVVTVNEEEIALAILKLAEKEKAVVEGAGATALAALLGGKLPELKGKKVVVPLTGGNIDPLTHSRVIEKGLVADGRLHQLSLQLKDKPGALAQLATLLGDAGANITEIHHNRTFGGKRPHEVQVLCTVETLDKNHVAEIHRELHRAGIEASRTQEL